MIKRLLLLLLEMKTQYSLQVLESQADNQDGSCFLIARIIKLCVEPSMFTICTLTVPVTVNIICLFFIYRLITSLISNKFYASLPLFFWFSFTDLIKHLLLPFSISDNHTFILYLLISDVSLKRSIQSNI